MKPLHERARELAGIQMNESTKNLERVLDKLQKKGDMGPGDAEHILRNVWAVEPRNVAAMDDFLNGDIVGDEPKWPADEIFKAYQKDTKAGERRPR